MENPQTLDIVDQSEEFEDINKRVSTKSGFSAFFENSIRKLGNIAFLVFFVCVLSICALCIAIALTPGVFLFQWMQPHIAHYPMILKSFLSALSIAIGFITFNTTIIFVVPVFNYPILPFVKPYRGAWVSVETLPWYYHNALTYLVRYTALNFLTPSPLNILFFKMMGMKIGKGVLLNTTNISDPCLIVLEDYVTIGGSVYMMAHYAMKGFLIIDKLHIKKGAMVGLEAKLLGGVTIGEKAVIGPNTVVYPKTVIKPGEKFGVPTNASGTA